MEILYGNHISKKDSELLEKVQRRSTKLVKPIKSSSYQSRLRQLGLPSLVYRWQRADMLQVFRILTEVDNVQINQSIQINKTSTKGHKFKFFKPIKSSSYQSRLRQLGLPSLVYRWQRADMLQVFRILTEVDNVQINQSIQINKTSTKGHKFKFFKPPNTKKNTLAFMAINEWNALSNDVKEAGK